MALEVGTYISDLVITNPVGATDPKAQGDDHIRLIKSVIKTTFPNITGAVTVTQSQLNDVVNKQPLGVAQNIQSANYTLVLGDAGGHILHPSADTSARTFTIPANASVAYPIGTELMFVNQNGAGTVTIAITSDTMRLAKTGTTGSRTLAANGLAKALKITATEWIIDGNNLS